MEIFLFYLFLIFGLIQLFYWLIFFSRILLYKSPVNNFLPEPVSIIVCAHNEAQNLKSLIPLLLHQKYDEFEVILIDDRSTDDTKNVINQFQEDKLVFEQIQQTPRHTNPKKYALKIGIEKAKYSVILLTDADCRPLTEEWLSQMQSQLSPKTDIVIGISPYQTQKTILNQLIQFETSYTSLQYLNAVLWKIPYMAVGRNLMYRKHIFDEDWWKKFRATTGGDDDLLISWKATANNTNICIVEASQVLSFPKASWKTWFYQKWRHLSVGTYYKPQIKLLLGVLNLSQIGFHSLFWSFFILNLLGFVEEVYWLWMIYLVRLFIFVVIMKFYLKKIKGEISCLLLPFLELLHTIYLFIVGIIAIGFKRNKW